MMRNTIATSLRGGRKADTAIHDGANGHGLLRRVAPRNDGWVIALGFVFLLSTEALAQKPGERAAPATPVIVTPVITDTFVDRGEALGTLKARETIDVTSPVTETVTAINFQDGQRVKAGDVLVEMTSAEESAMLQEERSTVNEALKQVERLRPLVEQGAASQSLLDQRKREHET